MLAATNFLLPNATFIAEVVAFLVVVGVLAKYVLPPINKALEERQADIRQGLEAGEEGRQLMEQTKVDRESILEEARREARSIVEQASKVAEQTRQDMVAKAKEEADRVLLRAQGEIERATERANEEVRQNLVELVITTAEKVIGDELDTDRHRRLIEDAVASFESSAS